jgi:hypothetical protein
MPVADVSTCKDTCCSLLGCLFSISQSSSIQERSNREPAPFTSWFCYQSQRSNGTCWTEPNRILAIKALSDPEMESNHHDSDYYIIIGIEARLAENQSVHYLSLALSLGAHRTTEWVATAVHLGSMMPLGWLMTEDLIRSLGSVQHVSHSRSFFGADNVDPLCERQISILSHLGASSRLQDRLIIGLWARSKGSTIQTRFCRGFEPPI